MDLDDSDAQFEAEADIDHRGGGRRSRRAGSGGSHEGERVVLAARGGIDSHFGEDRGEEEPLLGTGKDNKDVEGGGAKWLGMQEFEGLPWYKKPSLYWMLVPFFVLAVSFGGIMAPRVNLYLNLICREYLEEQEELIPGFIAVPISFNGDNPQCRIPAVQSRVAQFTLYSNLIAGLLSAFTAPKIGALSDRYGRTKMIAITSIGSLVGDVFTIAAALRPGEFSVNWILLGFFFDGICGSFTTAFAIVHAYVTDCVPPSTRNVAFAYFHACLFTGLAVGPILAGLLTRATGTPVTSFYIMLAVHIFFMIWVVFVTPESLSKSRQEHARKKHEDRSPTSATDWIDQLRKINILEPLKILWPRGPGTSPAVRRNLALLATVDTMMFGVAMGSMTVVLIYGNYQFGWDTFDSSVFMSIVNTCRVATLIVVLPIVTRLVRGKAKVETVHKNAGSDNFDLTVIRVAVFFDTLGYLGYTLARTGPLMILSGAVAAIGGMGSPTLQSALTKHVPPDRTGQLLGAQGLLHALARVVAPTIFNGIYSATVGKFTQTVFVCLTSVFGLAFVCSWFIRPGVYMEDEPKGSPDEQDEHEVVDGQ